MNRRTFIRNTGLAAGMIATAPLIAECKTGDGEPYELMDLHVHTTDQFTIEDIMKIADERKVHFGIVDHPAIWAIKDDADLLAYINRLRKYDVHVGLQPMISGWAKDFSAELISKLDYILMDPQTIPIGNGQYEFIWQLETYVDNTEDFMKRYMEHSLNILNNEPINIFGWPLFLPVCIARDYYTLWTEERMQQIIQAAKARNIAIEINDMAHTPHEDFILKAKAAGLKFTFGSDSRNQNAGRLAYCKEIAKKCNLTANDFYIPSVKK